MSELRLCKEDFLQYRTLEVQEKYYKKQLAELRDKYLIVDTVQDYRTGQARTVKIEDVQQAAYQREKALIEAIILEITQKRWIIRRTIDMAALDRDVEKSMQIVVALVVIGGERYEDAGYKAGMVKSCAFRYLNKFFTLPAVQKIFDQAVVDSKNNLRGLIA